MTRIGEETSLAITCSGTQFVFAHLGALDFRFWNILWAARTAKDFYKENIHFDISAIVTLVAGSPLEKSRSGRTAPG